MAGVAEVIAAINPTARVLQTQHSAVDPGDILDLRALAGLRCASRSSTVSRRRSAGDIAQLHILRSIRNQGQLHPLLQPRRWLQLPGRSRTQDRLPPGGVYTPCCRSVLAKGSHIENGTPARRRDGANLPLLAAS